jgi:hypothetical protein
MYIGTIKISKIYQKDNTISKIYKQSTIIYSGFENNKYPFNVNDFIITNNGVKKQIKNWDEFYL